MKKFIIATLAASILGTPVLAAPYQGRDDRGRIEQRHDDRGRMSQRHDDRGQFDNRGRWENRGRSDDRGPHRQMKYRGWHKGERFDYRQARNYRVINNPRYYHLHDAPRGYRWVQSGNDAVLIGITTGIIASVLANNIR